MGRRSAIRGLVTLKSKRSKPKSCCTLIVNAIYRLYFWIRPARVGMSEMSVYYCAPVLWVFGNRTFPFKRRSSGSARPTRPTHPSCVEKNLLSRRHCANVNRIYILQGKLGEVSALFFPRMRNETRLHACRQPRTSLAARRPCTADLITSSPGWPVVRGTRKLFLNRLPGTKRRIRDLRRWVSEKMHTQFQCTR